MNYLFVKLCGKLTVPHFSSSLKGLEQGQTVDIEDLLIWISVVSI